MSDITPGYIFGTAEGNGRLTSSKLNRMGNGATINPSFIANKPSVSAPATGDQLLMLKADGTYARVPATAFGSGGGTPASGVVIWGEIPTGAINGANQNYSTAFSYAAASLAVYLNGIRLRRGADYNETGALTFQLIAAPLTGDSLSVDYMKA
jgi:hypothetical protein